MNALSKNLEVWIRRGAREYNMSFVGGKKGGKLVITYNSLDELDGILEHIN